MVYEVRLGGCIRTCRPMLGDENPLGHTVMKVFPGKGACPLVWLAYSVGGREGQRWGRRGEQVDIRCGRAFIAKCPGAWTSTDRQWRSMKKERNTIVYIYVLQMITLEHGVV